MRARWTVLAWSLFGLFSLFTLGTLVLVFVGDATADEGMVVLCLGYALVGALVASREPGNAVGWLMLTIAVAFASTSFADAYILRGGRPGTLHVAWFSNWGWEVWLYLAAVILPLIFPDGRLLSRRWRPVLWLGVLTLLVSVASTMFKAGPLDVDTPQAMTNPTGIDGTLGRVLETASDVVGLMAAAAVVLAGASLIVRLRTSSGRAREQVKLFVYVGTVAVTALMLALIDVIVRARMGDATPDVLDVLGAIGWLATLATLVIGFPTAIGIAILRHRLYGIDVVINRTLVYGSLTVLLLATYLALVLTLRVVLSPLTGESDLAVAASTLAVAALFRPARARIQHVVDRRFFRSRYDAERTLESFSTRLRSELDLEALGIDLRDVVTSTMQPAHVSLWLRRTP